mmetsp:Transcript_17312/g.16516  ORF Transcript_17312/g.16516 Transcript_17312/m.16516 type:complete len:293 (-) Transcript_17312:193-1071(-)
MVRFEPGGHSNGDSWGASHLVPPVGREVEAVPRPNVYRPHMSQLKVRPLVVVWPDELDGRVIVRKPIVARVHKWPFHGRDDGEVLVAFKDAHHVLHGVCVGLGECPKAMPEGRLLLLEQRLHERRTHYVQRKRPRRILERIVKVEFPVFLLELVQKLSISHVDALGALGEVGESVVFLPLRVDHFIPRSFPQIGFILPFSICWPGLPIAFEEAWALSGYKVIEEALRGHLRVVTFSHLLFIHNVQRVRCCVVCEVAHAEVMPDGSIQLSPFGGSFFEDRNHCEEDDHNLHID